MSQKSLIKMDGDSLASVGNTANIPFVLKRCKRRDLLRKRLFGPALTTMSGRNLFLSDKKSSC